MSGRLEGKRVLVTHADRYLGPSVVQLFRAEGAEVLADETDYTTGPDVAAEVVRSAGEIEVLVANFAGPRRMMPVTAMLGDVTDTADEDFQAYLDELVWPLLRVVRAALPQMIERRSGKIVAATSATRYARSRVWRSTQRRAARRTPSCRSSGPRRPGTTCRSTGSVRPTCGTTCTTPTRCFPTTPVRESFEAQIPAGRLGQGAEAAELALALATGASDFLAGQVIPVSGGWAT